VHVLQLEQRVCGGTQGVEMHMESWTLQEQRACTTSRTTASAASAATTATTGASAGRVAARYPGGVDALQRSC
jgi:hypothetical protein